MKIDIPAERAFLQFNTNEIPISVNANQVDSTADILYRDFSSDDE
jgi:hypothetical protein